MVKQIFVNGAFIQERKKFYVFTYAVKSFQVLSASFIRVRLGKGLQISSVDKTARIFSVIAWFDIC